MNYGKYFILDNHIFFVEEKSSFQNFDLERRCTEIICPRNVRRQWTQQTKVFSRSSVRLKSCSFYSKVFKTRKWNIFDYLISSFVYLYHLSIIICSGTKNNTKLLIFFCQRVKQYYIISTLKHKIRFRLYQIQRSIKMIYVIS